MLRPARLEPSDLATLSPAHGASLVGFTFEAPWIHFSTGHREVLREPLAVSAVYGCLVAERR